MFRYIFLILRHEESLHRIKIVQIKLETCFLVREVGFVPTNPYRTNERTNERDGRPGAAAFLRTIVQVDPLKFVLLLENRRGLALQTIQGKGSCVRNLAKRVNLWDSEAVRALIRNAEWGAATRRDVSMRIRIGLGLTASIIRLRTTLGGVTSICAD